VGVASTKAFTSQVAALALISLRVARLRNLSILQGRQFIHALSRLPDQMAEILGRSDEVKELAHRFLDKTHNALYLGRGVNFPVALEGALKLKEISYIHAEGYPAAEMKHGPIALIDENMPVVFIAPKDAVHSKIVSNIEEVKARGGKVIALINEGDNEIERLADATFTIPVTLDLLTPILTSIPLQLLSYYVAVARGCNVDQPRNLAKSVTVE
jgi:glucosamine--fructose-6-phosphate aminotransferase (isomerizing)